MTTQVDHIPRTADITPRHLPGPSDDNGWTAEKVAEIAGLGSGPITVPVFTCCGQILGEVHNCDDNWVRG